MSTDPEQVIVYVTNRKWESKVSLNEPYLEHPWQQRILNDNNPHHWAYRSFIAYKSSAPNLSRVDFNMTTFYTPKERTDKHTVYWVCNRIVDSHVTWWIVTPNSSEYQKVAPSPRHKEFYGWTIQEEFYAVANCQKCLWQNTQTQLDCDNCKIKGREERRPELPPKPTGPPAIGAKPSLGTDEVSVLISNRRWESRAALDKPWTKEYTLGFEDGNQHHWAFKAFKAWKTAAPGRIKVTIDKVEFYAYEEEASTDNPHEGVLYYACQKPDHPKSWWIFCPVSADKAQYQKEGNLYTWKPTFQFYAKPDRESEAFFQEKEDRRRWQCEDCNHINPGYRMECEFCYESRLKESKQGIEVRRFGERAKSPTSESTPSTSTTSTSSSYVLSPPQKYTLPFQPGTPSKLSLLDLIKTKEK